MLAAAIEYACACNRYLRTVVETRPEQGMMSTQATQRRQITRIRRNAAVAVVLATALGGVASLPALAEDEGWHRSHERHEWRDRDWRERHAYVYAAPGYFYAPPSVVYVPPPVTPSVNFVFPLGR